MASQLVIPSRMQPLKSNPFLGALAALAIPATFTSALQAAPQTWDGEAGTNVLNTPGNWTNNSLPTSATDTATWDGTVAGPLSLVWNAAFGPGSGNSGGVNISLAATQTDSVQLDATAGTFGLGDVTIAAGAGALTLGDGLGTAAMTMRDPSMTFTNDSANTATIKSDVAFGNGGGAGNRPIAITGSGNWLFECALIPSGFSTSAILTKSGNGTLTLAAQSFQNSTTAINGGSILMTNGAALGTGAVTLVSGTAAKLQLANTITVANAINTNGSTAASATNGAIENSSGDNILNGNITWNQTGGAFANIASLGGTLTLNGTFTPAGGITGTRTLNLTGAGNIVSSSTNTISDGTATLGLRKSGAGIATVSGTNTYSGPTTLAGGTLSLGSAGAIATVGAVEFIGGTLQYSASNTTDYSARIAAGTSTSAISIDTNGQNITFATPLAAGQSGGLTKTGGGTLTLPAANGHGGTTTIKNGVLAVQNGGALSNGNVVIEGGGGTKQLALSGDIALAGPANIDIAGRFSVPSDDPANAAIVNTSGDNSISGDVRFAATGGAWVNVRSLAGTLTIGGSVTAANVTSTRSLNFTGAGDFTVNGVISNGTATTFGISKGGAGTLTLAGTNTYNGETSVRAGKITLASTGSIDSSASLAISAGATLDTTAKASFTLPTAVTLGIDGTSATSGLIDAGTLLDIDGAAVTFDVTGTLTAPSYVIANYTSLSGAPSFASATPPSGYTLDYAHNGGTQIALVQNTATAFDTWIGGYFGTETNPAIVGKQADPDGDGSDNLLEFALNGDPDDGSNNGLIAHLVQDASAPAGNELSLILAVRDGATFSGSGSPAVQTATKDGAVYTIEGSLDLIAFPGSAVSQAAGPADTAPAASGLPDLTGTDWEYHTFKLDASEGLAGKGFLRAKVEAAP